MIEQIVPSTICFACDVCCRFPDDTSPLRPYFTEEEIRAAMAAGVAPDAFPDHHGSQVWLVPHDEGYRCPAFCPETGHCGIYTARPLDCREMRIGKLDCGEFLVRKRRARLGKGEGSEIGHVAIDSVTGLPPVLQA